MSGLIDEIATLVNAALAEGWEPSGSLCSGVDPSGTTIYTQLMRKKLPTRHIPILRVPTRSQYI